MTAFSVEREQHTPRLECESTGHTEATAGRSAWLDKQWWSRHEMGKTDWGEIGRSIGPYPEGPEGWWENGNRDDRPHVVHWPQHGGRTTEENTGHEKLVIQVRRKEGPCVR